MNLKIGQKAKRSMKVTEKQIKMYAELTGDYNPIHFNEEFAAKTKFKKLIAQGGITTGILNAIVGMDMPGPGTVFLSKNFKFVKPVYIGDTITAEVKVLKIHKTKPVTQLKVTIKNKDNIVVLEGETWCYTMPTQE